MERFTTYVAEANKAFKIADHLIYVTYPVLQDNKLMATALEHLAVALQKGMAALSGLLGWPLARCGSRRVVVLALSLAIGCVSTALGLFWGYPLIGRLF